MTPTRQRFDPRFSQPGATATSWEDVAAALRDAELYWLATVREDGRPHVTPVIGVWLDDAAYFTTGPEEQKSKNLSHSALVALTTGVNTWASGHDVVVEGTATRRTERETLENVAAAIHAKYGDDWTFQVDGEGLNPGDTEQSAGLWRIDPAKVLSFAKNPHAQTGFYFS